MLFFQSSAGIKQLRRLALQLLAVPMVQVMSLLNTEYRGISCQEVMISGGHDKLILDEQLGHHSAV